jgi:hypothetical protein
MSAMVMDVQGTDERDKVQVSVCLLIMECDIYF